jgi:hypothetical protein
MTNMKLYIEKWTTETVHTGRLLSIDTETLREECPELQELSDEAIAQHIRDNTHDYDLFDMAEALEARNSSADHAEDSFVNVYNEHDLKNNLEWEAWRRGCTIRVDTSNPEQFLSHIPEYK